MVTIETPGQLRGSTREQLLQLQSYLYKTAQQLQWAFDTLEAAPAAGTAAGSHHPAGEKKPQEIFAGIKSLIIKSADIVEAYSEKIGKRLEGEYVAQSRFGSFQQETAQSFQADSLKFQQLFENQQSLRATVEGLYDQKIHTDAYVKTGLLEEDFQGKPIYGLEIGQRSQVDGKPVFDKFARFTSDRLSFFDSADVEVAYISDYRLCITNAEVTGSLTLGGKFRIYSGRGLVFQWTGGEGNG